MAKAKKLTEAQVKALKVLAKGPADFYDLVNVGAPAATISGLVRHGLCTEQKDEREFRTWTITPAGKAAHAAGHIALPE